MTDTQLDPIIVKSARGSTGTSGSSGYSSWGASNWMSSVSDSGYAASYGFAAAIEAYIDYASSTDFTVDWLNDLSNKDKYYIKDKIILFSNVVNISAATSYAVVTYIDGYQDTISKVYENTSDLHYGSGMPIAALAHFLFGSGSDLEVDINELGLKFAVQEIPHLQDLINSDVMGAHKISKNFAYSTYADNDMAGFTVGTVPLHVEGEFIRTSESDWSFNGVITGGTDRYDGNMDVSRSVIAQAATAVLAALEVTGDGTPYDINITGGYHLSLNQYTNLDWDGYY